MATSARAHACAICHRTFLPGESVRLYREAPQRPALRVCALCLQTAQSRGWEAVEQTISQPLRTPADPGRLEQTQRRDSLVDRLSGQLQTVERELTATQGSLAEAEQRGRDLGEMRERAARYEVLAGEQAIELEKLRHQVDEARAEVRRLEQSAVSAEEGERERVDASAARALVLRARAREGDVADLCGIAARAFNQSPHATEVRERAAAIGDPSVRMTIVGVALPRRIRIAFAWPREAREFIVSLDLVTREASIAETEPGAVIGGPLPSPIWTPANGLIVRQ
jgi:hypothetical protein